MSDLQQMQRDLSEISSFLERIINQRDDALEKIKELEAEVERLEGDLHHFQ